MADVNQIIKTVTDKYGKTRDSLMPTLQAIVKEKQFISDEDMLCVAKELDIAAADVYGTATFYTFLETVPRGKNVIRLCKTISCHMAGKDEIVEALTSVLKIKIGETTPDKKFTLLSANCLGWCHKGPVMLINDEIYPELTPTKAIEIIQEYMKK